MSQPFDPLYDHVAFICYPFWPWNLQFAHFFNFFGFWHLFWCVNRSRTKYDINTLKEIFNHPKASILYNMLGLYMVRCG